MKRSFDSIDIAKFIGSILIFAMHSSALRDFENAGFGLELLARWVVPFFFICSSYFLFRKSENGNIDRGTLIHYIKRIALLYLFWYIYNIPNIVYHRLYSKGILLVATWLEFLKNTLISSSFTGSWFLASCIFSAFIVYILSKKYSTKQVMIITLPLYIICVFMSAYKGLLPESIITILAFLVFPLNIVNGCFFFSVGKYISENEKELIKQFPKARSFRLMVLFFILFIMEIFLTKELGIFELTDATFSIIGVSVFLLILCIQIECKIKNGPFLRKLSTIIYCSQGNILLVNGLIRKILQVPYFISFVISVCPLIIVCATVIIIQKRCKWKWTEYLT